MPRKNNLEQKGVFQMLTALELEFLISRDIGPDWYLVHSYRTGEGERRVFLYNEQAKEYLACTLTGLDSGNPRLVTMHT